MKTFKRLKTDMLRAYVRKLGGSDQGSKKTLLTEIKRKIHRRCGQDRETGAEINVEGTTFTVTSTWSNRAMTTVLRDDQVKKLAAEIPLDSHVKSVIYASRYGHVLLWFASLRFLFWQKAASAVSDI